WMGRAYDPFTLRADPNLPTFDVPGLLPLPEVPADRLHKRSHLALAIDRQCRLLESAAGACSLGRHQQRALHVLVNSRPRRAFDLSAEPARLREAYGRTRLGQSCLLARRLVEAGVPFVTVDDDGWDHHAQVFPGLRKRLPELDRCLATLL